MDVSLSEIASALAFLLVFAACLWGLDRLLMRAGRAYQERKRREANMLTPQQLARYDMPDDEVSVRRARRSIAIHRDEGAA